MEKVSKSHKFVAILCGGTGPRLWPMSRAYRPKQFLKIFDDKSLLQLTYQRALGVTNKDRILVVSNKKYQKQIIDDLKIKKESLLLEPDKKNTMMATLLTVSRLKSDDIIGIFPSDHYILDLKSYKKTIENCFNIADKNDCIVVLGKKPLFANPGFGYIVPEKKLIGLKRVSYFVEKPDVKKADRIIKDGGLWNLGMYIFKVNTFEKELKKLAPEYYELYLKLRNGHDVSSIYKQSPSLPIDKVISEKSKKMVLVTALFDWSDVGEWRSIWMKIKDSMPRKVKRLNRETNVVQEKCKNVLVAGSRKKLIGIVGMENVAVIDTDDGLLVCNLNDSYSVRQLVAKITEDPKLQKYFLGEGE